MLAADFEEPEFLLPNTPEANRLTSHEGSALDCHGSRATLTVYSSQYAFVLSRSALLYEVVLLAGVTKSRLLPAIVCFVVAVLH